MLLNLSDVLTSEGMERHYEIPLEMTDFTGSLGSFPISRKSPVEFTFTNIAAGKVRMEGKADLTIEAECDRCLAKVPLSMALKFDRTVACAEAGASEDSDDDLSSMEGYQLNVEAFVYNEILVSWPMKILCSPECRGVCPVCGRNLNEGECGCDRFVPDPRMAAIQDIFNANKEV